MKKIIKKYGTSNIIKLDTEDMKIYNLKVGDFVELEITKIKKIKYHDY